MTGLTEDDPQLAPHLLPSAKALLIAAVSSFDPFP